GRGDGDRHQHLGALDRLHLDVGDAQECVAARAGISGGRIAAPRSVGQRRGPRDERLLGRYRSSRTSTPTHPQLPTASPAPHRKSEEPDKAYSSRAIRAHLRDRGIKAVIPEPDDQKGHRKRRGSRGGRPVGLDAADYRNRNVIERQYGRIKQWRGIATRYDKHAIVYRAAVVLNAVIAWAKTLSDTL